VTSKKTSWYFLSRVRCSEAYLPGSKEGLAKEEGLQLGVRTSKQVSTDNRLVLQAVVRVIHLAEINKRHP
jgi:hypothetical protein